jgi:hypothetical protein
MAGERYADGARNLFQSAVGEQGVIASSFLGRISCRVLTSDAT